MGATNNGKKRGVSPDGKPTALFPKQILASIPVNELLTWEPSIVRPVDLFKK